MHPRLSLSAISTFGWDLDRDLDFWAGTDVRRVGLAVRKLGPDPVAAARRVADAGLEVTNLLTSSGFRLDRPETWPVTVDELTRAVDASVAGGCRLLVLTTGPAGSLRWEEAAAAFGAAMMPVLDHAAAVGVQVAVEHTHALRADIGFVHTLRDAVALAAPLGLGVCMEVNACWTERGLADTVRAAVEGDVLALVQVSDYVVGTRCTPDRVVPGDGDIPLARVLGDVLSAGYPGDFDLELVGPRIEAEGYDSAIRRALARADELLTAAAR